MKDVLLFLAFPTMCIYRLSQPAKKNINKLVSINPSKLTNQLVFFLWLNTPQSGAPIR